MAKKNGTSEIPGDRAAWLAELTSALDGDQFFLVYQPTIDLQTNGFAGVEALLRWRRPVEGVVSPDEFIPDLKASGQMVRVGRWTLLTACLQGALWHSKGYRFTVSVNIASQHFERPEFVDDVQDAIDASRFDPTLLVLEVSQATLLSGGDATMRCVELLDSMGVRISVDDFALGRSSLEELVPYRVHVVKLNRASVEATRDSKKVAHLVHELVTAAKALNVQVIASGIEDSAQRKLLQLEQVDIGQGYLFARPYEVADIDRFLEDFALFSGKPI